MANIEKYIVDENLAYSDNVSVKTNFLVLFKFLKKLLINFNLLIKYIKDFEKSISTDDLLKEVLKNIHSMKMIFEINLSMTIGSETQVEVLNSVYIITRETNNRFVISKQNNDWETSNLIIQCKLDNGHLVYPAIVSFENTIQINFDESYLKNINKILKVYII